ncbi:nucleotidyltransferase family protein [Streptomyces sp. NPDC048106]|uniref:nucleotidyltransferase family protein n=1 Tax=Streptomyces sp. NPDC048106 TaxID=3155750 RepID=UPI003453586C
MDTQTAIMTLGRTDPPSPTVAAALNTLDGEITPEDLYAILSRSKVTRLAHAALDGHTTSAWATRLRELLADEVRQDDAWQAQAAPKMREVVAAVEEFGGRIIKGLCAQSVYPRPELRHLGDVDVQFPQWAAARPLVDWLRERDWVYDTDEMPWLKWHDNGALYGQVSLVYPDTKNPYARVDLHIGAFSVGHAGLLPLAGWRAGTALGLPATVPSVETSIAITAAHALCDQMLSVKDVNDLHALVSHTTPDWVSVSELCRSVRAQGALARVVNAVRQAYPESTAVLPPDLGEETGLELTPPGPEARAEAFAALAYDDERARGASEAAATALADSARHYFSADLSPRVADPDGGAAPGDPGRDRCWRLVSREVWDTLAGAESAAAPAEVTSVELADGITLFGAPNAWAVRYGNDVLVPTVWGEISRESLALARRLTAGPA